MSNNEERWREVHSADEPKVKVYKAIAGTHTELGQQLLGDPLSLLEDREGLKTDATWHVQMHVANAAIPTGPLPLPEEIPSLPEESPDDLLGEIWRVIRKIIGFLTVLEDLKIVIVVVARFDTDRQEAKRVLGESRQARAKNRASHSDA